METLNFENYKTWTYTEQKGLSDIENLKEAHNHYDKFQNSCQEGLVYAAIKLGEIYADAKIELGSDEKLATNQKVADYFEKTEATIRNYIKIAENRDIIFETPVSQTLSVRNMIKIINGTAKQNLDGSVTDETETPRKPTVRDIKKYTNKISKLEDENKTLKDEIANLKKYLKELEKIKAKATAIFGEEK